MFEPCVSLQGWQRQEALTATTPVWAVPADIDVANGVTDVGIINLVTFQVQIINYLAFG
ncbi:MAG: hypothetical protein JO297_20915 [Nitrososphaeraceae archaeon]|nr:hypothetical protein [Nitrososphaeraceae archaeon]